MRLKLVKNDTNFDFLKLQKMTMVLSIFLVLASIGLFATVGLNLGIDFKGGILLEARNNTGPADISKVRNDLDTLKLGDVSLQGFGTETDVLIRIQRQEGDEKAQIAAIKAVTDILGSDFDIRRTEFVGPTVGAELAEKGVLAVICALMAILVYIWFRFEWQFSIAAILALSHDVLTTIGLFSLTSFEFNLATVAAILTIAGYSINDTVVVFDRVRENLRRYKSYEQRDILNRSLNETLSRTVMTSVTTLLALTAIVIFGGAVLRDFALAMIWGVVIGTYSSVFIAVGMLSRFDLKRVDQDDDGVEVPEYER
ncbi:MAG: protein translocase subunit SecF [Candidatus Puniceispirillum sp.]|jgi:preprotein translocase SecF subunit|uniref:protein translocase subunit SecF n=1 Tax=Candidatus Puniceispirillum sp. TaxID=2026719 RepID=UPI001EC9D7EE|nr:protein translocase subunit SecF [Candidatus Puniceispirillum sp.]MBT6415787.1 protein translocase subunit SecF [Candidatus Puniceispirillum sp.]MBT6566559.1 protein translocase subunit SecF [Candidatus Puniceispirillum sp.]